MIPRPGHLAPALVLLAAAFAALPVAEAAPRKFSFGPVAGYSMQSSGPHSYSGHYHIDQEITLGRTFLLGATAELRWAHDHVAMELVAGPYHGDFETSCVVRGGLKCEMDPPTRVKVGGHLEVRYLRTFGGRQWRPLVGTGIGFKGYTYRSDSYSYNGSPSVTNTLGIGVERSGRKTLRAEIRGVLVWQNPLFATYDGSSPPRTYELQARISMLFPE